MLDTHYLDITFSRATVESCDTIAANFREHSNLLAYPRHSLKKKHVLESISAILTLLKMEDGMISAIGAVDLSYFHFAITASHPGSVTNRVQSCQTFIGSIF